MKSRAIQTRAQMTNSSAIQTRAQADLNKKVVKILDSPIQDNTNILILEYIGSILI